VSTIHQALKRNHLVAAQPSRPRKARKRFERDRANDLWQIDATQTRLADGKPAWVLDIVDDHARFLVAALACASPTGEAAWASLMRAGADFGLPRQLLSDNHVSFTGRLFGHQVAFERNLAGIGVQLINTAPSHPQTIGKLERLHRTLKEWLRDQPQAHNLPELQTLLDRFQAHYNHERPHQGIDDQTPAERYRQQPQPNQPPTQAGQQQPTYPTRSILRKVMSNGAFCYRCRHIHVGNRFAGATVRIVEIGDLIHAYYGDQLIRSLVPDPTHLYQPSERPRRKRTRKP
jgi:transposase InsO family protein